MLKDDTIAGILRGRINRSNGFLDSRMTMEREKVLEYYNGKRPFPLHKGNSKYVSNDVFDSVESMKAQLLETFCGSYQPVRFMPQGAQDVREAQIATEVTNFVVDRQNQGFRVKADVLHDGLLGRMGVLKIWWEDNEEESEECFEAPDDDSLSAYMANNPDAQMKSMDLHPETGAIQSATFTRKTSYSQVKIESVPPEEFGISGGARSVEDADLTFHRHELTIAELVAMGYPQDVVEDLPTGHEWLTNYEAFVRAGDADPNPFLSMDNEDQKAGKRVEVFECYTKLDMDGDKGKSQRRLWKIVYAGNKVLDKEQVKRVPFKVWTPLPRAHTVWGENFALRVMPTQDARTSLTRAIVDHALITTNPRYTVLRGGLANPTELMENRIGGVVNLTKPDAVQPLMQSGLNPFVFQTIGLLDEDKEETTGISKLSQGLNKDALSKQNSGEMVENLINVSQVRQKVIARRFAEFLSEVYLEVYALLVENATQEFIVEVAGDYVQVDPNALKERRDLSVDFTLGYGEKAKEAAKYVQLYQMLTAAGQSDPSIAQAFGTAQKYEVIKRTITNMGIKDVSSVIADPKTLKPAGPNPAQQMAMQKAQADVAMQTAQAQATTQKVQLDMQKAQANHELEMAKLQQQHAQITSELQLKAAEFQHKVQIDAAELRMAVDDPTRQEVATTPKA